MEPARDDTRDGAGCIPADAVGNDPLAVDNLFYAGLAGPRYAAGEIVHSESFLPEVLLRSFASAGLWTLFRSKAAFPGIRQFSAVSGKAVPQPPYCGSSVESWISHQQPS